MITPRVHAPALRTPPPDVFEAGVETYRLCTAAPQLDQPGKYPTWTVLMHSAGQAEYVVWTAIFNDDRDEWSYENGDYFREHAEDDASAADDAHELFWERARMDGWRP